MTASEDQLQQIPIASRADPPRSVELRSITQAIIQKLLQEVESLPLLASTGFARARAELRALPQRLAEGRLQIAVVGQFKRGKSTLINALLGADVLPASVTPLTAIPTFIYGGPDYKVSAWRTDARYTGDFAHRFAHYKVSNTQDLTREIAKFVTEDENPENRLQLTRVDVQFPAPFLGSGIVLIDTPGVGSTFAHNTETAKATLPECDSAIFVISPDPPITEVEVAYLRELRDITPNLIVVLNKCDLVEGADREKSERFVHRTLGALGLDHVPYFAVSARHALRAKLDHDSLALAASGLGTLEEFLRDYVGTSQDALLRSAIARRAAIVAREMVFEAECRRAALRLPMDELSDKLTQFEADERTFTRERNASRDLLAGDRARLLSDLDDEADRLRTRILGELREDIDARLKSAEPETSILEGLRTRLPVLFQAAFNRFEADARQRLEMQLSVHQQRGDALISKVRKRATDLLAVPFAAPDAGEAFVPKKSPFWVTDPRESLSSVPVGALDTILPPAARRRRLRDRLARQADEVVLRNVENLRWAVRQNLEDAIRGFQAKLDDRLRLSQNAAREALELGLRRREQGEGDVHDELVQLTEAIARLSSIADMLERSG